MLVSKAKTVAVFALAAFPIVFTLLAFPFLPETIAFHFGAGGVDEWRPKSAVFLAPGIMTVVMLFVSWMSWMMMRPRKSGEAEWIVAGEGMNTPSFGLVAAIFILMDAAIAVYLGYNLFFIGSEDFPSFYGETISIVLPAFVMLLMWGTAAYLISGRGVHAINLHPGLSEREQRIGDGAKQSRAVGFLVLFLSFVCLAILLAPMFMKA